MAQPVMSASQWEDAVVMDLASSQWNVIVNKDGLDHTVPRQSAVIVSMDAVMSQTNAYVTMDGREQIVLNA